jgi:murein L,D-transpeptidase YafK
MFFQYSEKGPVITLTIPADIGKVGGNKTQENDHKTPEGIYLLQTQKHKPPPYELYGDMAFTSDYPNIFDRIAGKTGYGIWLHAIPDTTPLTRGSRGCVVVRNESIKQLAQHIEVGRTPMIIFDRMETLTESEQVKLNSTLMSQMESWRTSWTQKKMEDYISFYDSGFSTQGMNRNQWQKYKEGLAQKYAFIQVETSNITAILFEDQVLIKFMQKYTSDKLQDLGEKTIHAYLRDGKLKIVKESWLQRDPPAPTPEPAANSQLATEADALRTK